MPHFNQEQIQAIITSALSFDGQVFRIMQKHIKGIVLSGLASDNSVDYNYALAKYRQELRTIEINELVDGYMTADGKIPEGEDMYDWILEAFHTDLHTILRPANSSLYEPLLSVDDAKLLFAESFLKNPKIGEYYEDLERYHYQELAEVISAGVVAKSRNIPEEALDLARTIREFVGSIKTANQRMKSNTSEKDLKKFYRDVDRLIDMSKTYKTYAGEIK